MLNLVNLLSLVAKWEKYSPVNFVKFARFCITCEISLPHFRLIVTFYPIIIAATSCGSFMNGPSGEIKTPEFPAQYKNDLYCTWKITVPTNKKVRIEFSNFKTDPNDILYIYDTDKSEPIVQFSGLTYKPKVLTSSGRSLRIRFVSNEEKTSTGFRLTYSQTGKF